MQRRRLLILLAFAFPGFLLTWLLFNRYDPSAGWNYSLDRSQAVAKAREITAGFGINTEDWADFVEIEYNRNLDYYFSLQKEPILGEILTPLTTSVRLIDLESDRLIRIDLNSYGKFVGLSFSKPRKTEDQQKAQSEKSGTQIANSLLAEQFASRVLGNKVSRFTLSDAGSGSNNEPRFRWVGKDERYSVVLGVVIEESELKTLTVETSVTPEFRKELDGRRSGFNMFLSLMGALIFLPLALLIVIFYFLGLARRHVQHPITLILLIISFIYILLTNTLGSFWDDFIPGVRFSTSSVNYWVAYILPRVFYLLVNLIIALGLYFTWAAGQALALNLKERKTVPLELFLKGKILTGPVMGNILAGLLAGGVMSALPYLTTWSGLSGPNDLSHSGSPQLFISQIPVIASFGNSDIYLIFVLFAFGVPLVESFIKRPWPARAAVFLIALFAMEGIVSVYTPASALVITGALTALLLTLIYFGFGLLGVIVTAISSHLTVSAFALISQPTASLQISGMITLAVLGIAMSAALVGLVKSREVTPEETAVPEGLLNAKLERERLKAEFEVARRAQVKMLPDTEPRIDGFEIAAVCRPSKEVGGDLYDFLMMPEGRLGVVVADVSGKGVPASLYMTLTKGLLDSITEVESDPGEILKEVNRHLYEVCRRKVFVTLFLGIIDPKTRTLAFARAGHNPPVHLKSSENKAIMLKPRGMGLGLITGRAFDDSLKVESVKLEEGDLLIFYSDGITEAMDFKNEEFGEERLIDLALKVNGMKADDVRDMVMTEVGKFLGPSQPQDDQTLVVVKVL